MAQKKKKEKGIGIKVALPKESCEDSKCPFHGNVKLRGKIFTGTVTKAKMQNSAVVEWERRRYVKKYERYEKRRTKIKVHNSPCIDAKEGNIVKILETRPLSKTIHGVIVEVIGADNQYYARKEGEKQAMSIHQKDNQDTEAEENDQTEESKEE